MEKWSVEQLPAPVSGFTISSFEGTVLSLFFSFHVSHLFPPSCVCISVDCGWSSWTQWSACSRTCDVGVRRRYRSGTNPPAAFGGRPCTGDRVGIDSCSIEPCFGKDLILNYINRLHRIHVLKCERQFVCFYFSAFRYTDSSIEEGNVVVICRCKGALDCLVKVFSDMWRRLQDSNPRAHPNPRHCSAV